MSYIVPHIRTVHVDRYVLPLTEGGSKPGLIEADDGEKYVIKFRGAAQGPKVLISELIGGEIARALGLNVPELVFAQLDEAYGRMEPDEDIQAQFKASVGLNIALRYLPCSISYDPNVKDIGHELASQIVWLDSLLTNMDRTARNTNMLIWERQLWLIDHGASLYFHYKWDLPPAEQALRPFSMIKNHVLIRKATMLDKVNKKSREILTREVIHNILAQVPDEWLEEDSPFATAAENRQAYETYLVSRIQNAKLFIKEVKHARKEVV